MCGKHYQRFIRHGDPLHKRFTYDGDICSVEGCETFATTRGWCNTHYSRWRIHGDPLKVMQPRRYPSTDIYESFLDKTQWVDGCLIWTAAKLPSGYGMFWASGKLVTAHRYSWENSNGEIPEGMHIDHICWNTSCVNTEHLRLSTPSQNGTYLQGPNSNTVSGYRNVHKYRGGWRVVLYKNKTRYDYGYFNDLEHAAKVAESARSELFGEFAGRG